MSWPFYTAWPFKYVNGEQTEESKTLGAQPQPKPLTAYESVMAELRSSGDPETEQSPL